jgi:hypothetical protein
MSQDDLLIVPICVLNNQPAELNETKGSATSHQLERSDCSKAKGQATTISSS